MNDYWDKTSNGMFSNGHSEHFTFVINDDNSETPEMPDVFGKGIKKEIPSFLQWYSDRENFAQMYNSIKVCDCCGVSLTPLNQSPAVPSLCETCNRRLIDYVYHGAWIATVDQQWEWESQHRVPNYYGFLNPVLQVLKD